MNYLDFIYKSSAIIIWWCSIATSFVPNWQVFNSIWWVNLIWRTAFTPIINYWIRILLNVILMVTHWLNHKVLIHIWHKLLLIINQIIMHWKILRDTLIHRWHHHWLVIIRSHLNSHLRYAPTRLVVLSLDNLISIKLLLFDLLLPNVVLIVFH